MEISVIEQGDVNVVRMKGKFDTLTSPDAERELMGLIDAGSSKIVINFEELVYISSTGLRVLLILTKKLNQIGGGLRVCSANDIVREVFEISGFDTFLTLMDDEASALESL